MFIRKVRLSVYKIESPSLDDEASNLDIRLIESLHDIPNEFTIDETLKEIYQDRFQQNHLACVAFRQNVPLHLSWIAFNQLRVDEIKALMKLSSNLCCIYNSETISNYRGQGIYQAVLRYISRWWLDNKEKKVLIYVQPNNASSLAGIRKTNFEYAGEITATILMNKIVFCRKIKLNNFHELSFEFS